MADLKVNDIVWAPEPLSLGVDPFHGIVLTVTPSFIRVRYWRPTGNMYELEIQRNDFSPIGLKRCTNQTTVSVQARASMPGFYTCPDHYHWNVDSDVRSGYNPTSTYALNPNQPSTTTASKSDYARVTGQKENLMNNVYAHSVRTKDGWVGQVLMGDSTGSYTNNMTDEIVWQSEPVSEPEKDDKGAVTKTADRVALDQAKEYIKSTVRWLFSEDSPVEEPDKS